MNLYQLLRSGFPEDQSKIALETPGGFQLTWQQIDEATAQYANYLTSLHLPQGARIVTQLEKSPDSLLFYLATVRAGFVYVPLNTAYQEEEIAYFMEDATPDMMVCTAARFDRISLLAKKLNVPHVLTLDEEGTGTLKEAAKGFEKKFATVEKSDSDLVSLIYTSGTTGRSKGAMLSHGNLGSNAEVLREYWGWKQDDVLLHFLPIFHVHGLFVATHGAMLAGARMIWLNKFNVDTVLEALPQSTVMMGVPTHYVRLLADPRFDRRSCRNMRLFISGSAPLLIETFKEFEKRSGRTILERYGLSETAMLVSNPYHARLGARYGGTVGRPLPRVSLRIVDEQGRECRVNEIGEIQAKGPNVFQGYWQMPEKTREAFTQDGWFKTGDLGRWGGESGGIMVPDDYVTIVGRSKDLVISGGYNVYPKEIESILDDMDGVDESAVIGIPHPDFGEAVVAIIVPRKGFKLDTDKMRSELKGRLANYKVPKHIYQIAELPRNAMGKVQKKILREQFNQL